MMTVFYILFALSPILLFAFILGIWMPYFWKRITMPDKKFKDIVINSSLVIAILLAAFLCLIGFWSILFM